MENSLKSNKAVLITGASSGIGCELAKLFAKDGYNLVLIARDEKKLKEIKNYLKVNFNIEVTLIKKDLAKLEAAKEIFDEIQESGIEIDILINNAGAGYCGLFHEINIEKDIQMLQLNINSLTYLTKLFSREMVKKKKGKILNVASTGAYQPGPYIAVYYASKAYVLSFSEAIENELKDYGITVSVLCPGATKTEFSKNAGKKDIKNSMSAEAVASIAYREFKRGKRLIVPGNKNKLAILFSKIASGRISAKVVRKIQESMVKKFKEE